MTVQFNHRFLAYVLFASADSSFTPGGALALPAR